MKISRQRHAECSRDVSFEAEIGGFDLLNLPVRPEFSSTKTKINYSLKEKIMASSNPPKSLFAHYPNLGKLTLAIIEHSIEPVLGKDAVAVIGEPHSNRELYNKLCEALVRAEEHFIKETPDAKLAAGLMQLQLANSESVRKAFWEFAKDPVNPDLPILIYKQFSRDYSSIPDSSRQSAVARYRKILMGELINIDDGIRQRISSVALLSIQTDVENIANTLGSIDKSTKTIAELLSQRNPPLSTSQETSAAGQESSTALAPDRGNRILVIYASCFEKDSKIAHTLVQWLSKKYAINSQDILSRDGDEWAEKIESEIEDSDLIIPVISENVSLNELLIFEIDKAYRLFKSNGLPRIVPVRLRYTEPYPYPLSEYISESPCIPANGAEKDDILKIVVELNKMLSGQPFGVVLNQDVRKSISIPRPSPSIDPYNYSTIDNPRGTMDPESGLYIKRPEDEMMEHNVGRKQALINIKAPRQMGKSSMLVRGVEQARQAGKKIVYLDFQQLDSEHLRDNRLFYITFCNWVAGNLNVDVDAETFWKSPGSNNIKCTKFFKDHILGKLNQPLMLAIDEVDRLLGSPFKSDFFGLLRSWHIDRQSEAMSRLSMMLVISTEPVLLIDDIASPFNVGENLNLDDFSPEQVAILNIRHNSPFSDSQLYRLMTLVGGHPYLVRLAMYKVLMKEISAEKLLSTACLDDGPYADHLLHHLFQLNRSVELRHAMWQILKENASPSDESTYRLKGAGLVREKGHSVIVRYGIYADYFRAHLKVG